MKSFVEGFITYAISLALGSINPGASAPFFLGEHHA